MNFHKKLLSSTLSARNVTDLLDTEQVMTVYLTTPGSCYAVFFPSKIHFLLSRYLPFVLLPSFPFFFSEGPGTEVFLAENVSSALVYFSAWESISKNLIENFFSRLKRNLEDLRAPFMVDMMTI